MFSTRVAGEPSGRIWDALGNWAILCVMLVLSIAAAPVSAFAAPPSAASKVVWDFTYPNGYAPSAPLAGDAGNNLYGVARLGGPDGGGTIFYAADKSGTPTATDVVAFGTPEAPKDTIGEHPAAPLLYVPTQSGKTNGTFYGTTTDFGPGGSGTVFQFTPGATPGSGTVTVLVALPCKVVSVLTTDASAAPGQTWDKTLYGSSFNGKTGCGELFELQWNSSAAGGPAWQFSDLYDFPASGLYGKAPNAITFVPGLGGAFSFFGTTFSEGEYGNGTLFEVTPTSGSAPPAATIELLHSFTPPDGFNPNSQLVLSGGLLYGTSLAGGSTGNGTLFYATTSGIVVTFHNFSFTDGEGPNFLGTDAAGNIYGTTKGGGKGAGTLFSLSQTNSFNWSYPFPYKQGLSPNGFLSIGPSNFVVTCAAGSTNGVGSVIYGASSIPTPPTNIVFYPFDAPGGTFPASSLLAVGAPEDQTLYGTTSEGGPNNTGTVFGFVPGGDAPMLDTIFSFDQVNANSSGAFPNESLIADSLGNLWGTTEYGGSVTTIEFVNGKKVKVTDYNNTGVIYELSFDSTSGVWTEKPVFAFAAYDGNFDDGANLTGSYPHCALVAGPGGLLYGTTLLGGSTGANGNLAAGGSGTIFSINPSTGQFASIYSFAGPNSSGDYLGGFAPNTLYYDSTSGLLYGTTEAGGQNGYGLIFSLDPTTNPVTFTDVYDFVSAVGSGSSAGLSEAIDAATGDLLLIGTAQYGGSSDLGTLFQYDLTKQIAKVDLDFDGISNGANPTAGVLIVPDGGSVESGNVRTDVPVRGTFHIELSTFDGKTNGKATKTAAQAANQPSVGGAFLDLPEYGATALVLDPFDGANGSNPADELTYGSDGYYYGTAQYGGTGFGTIVQVTHPVIGLVTPPSATIGSAVNLNIAGSGFVAGATVTWKPSGSAAVALLPSSIMPGQILVTVPASDNTSTGVAQVSVTEAGPTAAIPATVDVTK
jgi:uncharacterized repeat protein (TIGR03803 family)